MIVPENVRPAMMAPPRPRQSGSESVIGISPAMVAKEVNAMASNLETDPSTIDSTNSIPLFKLTEILSTIRIEFLTTIPNKASTPIRAGNDKGV